MPWLIVLIVLWWRMMTHDVWLFEVVVHTHTWLYLTTPLLLNYKCYRYTSFSVKIRIWAEIDAFILTVSCSEIVSQLRGFFVKFSTIAAGETLTISCMWTVCRHFGSATGAKMHSFHCKNIPWETRTFVLQELRLNLYRLERMEPNGSERLFFEVVTL